MSVLLHLSKQPGCGASAGVRVLVEGLLHGIISVSEFVTGLQRLFNVLRISRSLIPFLTVRSLNRNFFIVHLLTAYTLTGKHTSLMAIFDNEEDIN
jgi:hypothetical protein